MNQVNQVALREETMTSYDFWKQINVFRQEEGENVIRHDQFLARVLNELELDKGVCKTFAHPQNGQEYKATDLNKDQMLLVGMRESKGVRKRVLVWLKELTKPKTQLEVLQDTIGVMVRHERELEEQGKRLTAIEDKLEILEPGHVKFSELHGKHANFLSEATAKLALTRYGWPTAKYTAYTGGGMKPNCTSYAEKFGEMTLEDFFKTFKKNSVQVTNYLWFNKLVGKRFQINL